MSGTVRIDNKYELGKVTVPVPTTLPAHARTPLSVPLSMNWQNLTTLTGIMTGSAQAETIPYTVTGTVAVGGEKLSFDVPFQVQGTLTRQQIMQAAVGSIPGGLPALPSLPAPVPAK